MSILGTDVSSYPHAQQQNPLQSMELMQAFQQMRGQTAMGQALAASGGDTGQALQALQGSPQGGLAMAYGGQALSAAREAEMMQAVKLKTQLDSKNAEAENYQNGLTAAGQILAGHLTDPGGWNPSAVTTDITQLHKDHPDIFDLPTTMQLLQRVSQIGDDPVAGRQFLMNASAFTQKGAETAQRLLPNYQPVPGRPGLTQDMNPLSQSYLQFRGAPSGLGLGQSGQIPDVLAAATPVTTPGPGGVGTTTTTAGGIAAKGLPNAQGTSGGVTTPPGINEYKQNLDSQVNQDRSLMYQLREIGSNLDRVNTGGGAEARTNIANLVDLVPDSVFQSTGLDRQKVMNEIQGGTGPMATGTAQEINKLMTQSAIMQAHSAVGGSNPMNRWLEETFTHANPNLNMQPDAIKSIMGFYGKVAQLNAAEQSAFNSAMKSGKDLSTWQNDWNQGLLRHKVFGYNPNEAP